jgi:hypothetical protein
MSIPGFQAEASLLCTSLDFYSAGGSRLFFGVRPAWIFFQFPEIKLSWQPSNVVAGQGSLTIAGDSFPPDVDVMLTISNCSEGGIPCRKTVHTSTGIGNKGRFYFPGGTFRTTVPMFCGGDTTVTAQSLVTSDRAQASTSVNC